MKQKSLEDRMIEALVKEGTFEETAEVLPDIREVIEDDKTRNIITRMILEDQEWATAEKEAKRQRKPLKDTIKRLLGTASKFMCNDYRVNYFNAPRKAVNVKKLIAAGVSQKVIDACTDVKPVWTLKITGPGVEEEDE